MLVGKVLNGRTKSMTKDMIIFILGHTETACRINLSILKALSVELS